MDTFIFRTCKCKCCRKCVKGYFEKLLKKKQWPINCILCKTQCDQQDFILFGKDIHQKYFKLEDLEILKHKTMQCASCGKHSLYSEWVKKKKKELWNCPICKSKYCFKCGIAWKTAHNSLSCQDARKIMSDPRKFKKCTKCNVLLVNATADNGNDGVKYELMVFCQKCNNYNCFICGFIAGANDFGIAMSHQQEHKMDVAPPVYKQVSLQLEIGD